jgi:hypothetical protein
MQLSNASNRATMKAYIPADLKEWLEDRSVKNFRSTSKELAAILSALRRAEEDDPEGFAKFGTAFR